MDPRRLEAFTAVARERSFTRAAAALHLSQSAVSQQVAALEGELAGALFDRSRRRVALTPAGVALLPWAERLLADHEVARRAVTAARGEVAGTLALASSLTIAAYLLPRPLAELARRNPGVRVELRVENTEHVVASLRSGAADLGLVEGDVPPDGVELVTLREDELVLIAPAGHRFARDEEVDLAALAAEPFVARERGSGSRQIVEGALARAGLDPAALRTVAELAGIETIKGVVEAGLGVAIVSALSIRRELALGTLVARPIRGVTIRRALAAAVAAGQPVLPAARELLRLVSAPVSTLAPAARGPHFAR